VAERLRLAVRGAVQGVGFRPFVYRLARDRQLRGWCRNSPHGVLIEVEGERPALDEFRLALEREQPPRAAIQGIESSWLDPAGLPAFEIHESEAADHPSAVVMPDIALCESCRGELLDPNNRRYRYPFINCTNCGPRYSIIEALPYDRAHTSMRVFVMCHACHREYRDPLDRRFHAEPNACPVCGPHVALWDATGAVIAERDQALIAAANAIRAGEIVAVKGLGGFQLLVDATDEAAVQRLRARKHRDEKPFAMMCPDLECVQQHARIGPDEAHLLSSPEAPIVLVDARRDGPVRLAPSVAPGSRQLGVMLPSTPLHVLLMRDLRRPIVATSGNQAEEPICFDEHEVVARLGGIADLFLVHNRPIVRHVDDSVVRVARSRPLMLRRARGYAPWPIDVDTTSPPVLGVGAHLKNTVALTAGPHIVVSQHIGDLATERALDAFRAAIDSLSRLYDVEPETVAVDLHPGYLSTRYGRDLGLPVFAVQHHYAHLAACMADNGLTGPVAGAVWDGSGYGTDGTVWGGEFLRTTDAGFERLACLRPFRLPGGESAVREPRRSALGLLTAHGGEAVDRWRRLHPEAFAAEEWRVLARATARGVNAPVTSSVGRLIDAASAIIGARQVMRFEGQAAMELEQLIDAGVRDAYPFALTPADDAWLPGAWQAPGLVVDWAPLVEALLVDAEAATPTGVMAARLHNTLAEIAVTVALALGESRLLLTGGCFQNRYLTEQTAARLDAAGVRPYWHQRLPPNDGAIAAGQIVAWQRARAGEGGRGRDGHGAAMAAGGVVATRSA